MSDWAPRHGWRMGRLWLTLSPTVEEAVGTRNPIARVTLAMACETCTRGVRRLSGGVAAQQAELDTGCPFESRSKLFGGQEQFFRRQRQLARVICQ